MTMRLRLKPPKAPARGDWPSTRIWKPVSVRSEQEPGRGDATSTNTILRRMLSPKMTGRSWPSVNGWLLGKLWPAGSRQGVRAR